MCGLKYLKKIIQDNDVDIANKILVTICAYISPNFLPKNAQYKKPINGKNTTNKINFLSF